METVKNEEESLGIFDIINIIMLLIALVLSIAFVVYIHNNSGIDVSDHIMSYIKQNYWSPTDTFLLNILIDILY